MCKTSELIEIIEAPKTSAPVEHRRKMREPDPEFEEKARRNNEQLMRTHEFRKDNIKEMELGDKDYFEYNPDEPQRYAALNLEHMFRFESTFSAIKWGVFVGSLFAFHRYYRTRDINNAAHWFTIMSFFSFFNIWISNGLQHFMSDYTVRKSISLSQRNEHYTTAYRAYYEAVQDRVDPIDSELKVQPIIKNSQAESLNQFIENYQKYLKAKYAVKNSKKEAEVESEDMDFAKEILSSSSKPLSQSSAKLKLQEVLSRVEGVDLKSYNFDQDPDCVYL